MEARVSFLQYKQANGRRVQVDEIEVDFFGIRNQPQNHELRQVLITDSNTFDEFEINAGALSENIVLDCNENFYEIESGTRIKLGTVELSLTYLCEPCKKVSHIASSLSLIHI